MSVRPKLVASALALGALLSGLFVAGRATAQTTPTLAFAMANAQDRNAPDVPDKGPEKINLKDCQNDDFYTFHFQTTGLTSGSPYLYAWQTETSMCSDPMNQGAGNGLCHEIAPSVNAGGNGVSMKVRIQDIVSTASGPYAAATADVCTGFEHPAKRTIQFFLKDSSSNMVIGAPITYDVFFDLAGPPPPTGVHAGAGQNVLVIDWKAPDYSAQEIGEYRAYRARLDSGTDGGAAGAGSDPGDAGDGGTETECAFAGLTPDMPPGAGTTKCGETNGRTTQVECAGLTNGARYAVGVATVDTYYNVGLLSSPTCGTPEPVTGFFEAYRAAGGAGGGGYCAIGAVRSRATALGVVLAALGLIARRARRRAVTAKGAA